MWVKFEKWKQKNRKNMFCCAKVTQCMSTLQPGRTWRWKRWLATDESMCERVTTQIRRVVKPCHSYGGSRLARINTGCGRSVRGRRTDRAAAAGASHLCCTGGAKVRPDRVGIETNYGRSIFSRTGAISSSNTRTGKKDKSGDYSYTEWGRSTSLDQYPTRLLKQAVMMERPGTLNVLGETFKGN